MTDFQFDIENEGVCIRASGKKDGLFGLFQKREAIDLTQLAGSERTLAIALSRIRAIDCEDKHHRLNAEGLWLDHWMVSRLDDLSANVLGLPKRLSGVEFHAEMNGNIGSDRFSLDWRWDRAGRTIRLTRTGAIVDDGSSLMRLPGPIYDAIVLSGAFDNGRPLPEHWRALSEFRAAIGAVEEKGLARPDGYLRKVEIVTCDKVGLALVPDDPLGFAPLPFVGARLDVNEQPSESSAALSGSELEAFKSEANARGSQPAYRVGKNRFVILDRSVVPIVDVIAKHAAGSDEEKRNFLENADRIVADAIEQALIDDGKLNDSVPSEDQVEAVETALENAWAETREWSERVIEIRQWTKPDLEILEGSGTNWLPQDIDAALGELLGSIPDEKLHAVLDQLLVAQNDCEKEVLIELGVIPVVDTVIQAVSRRLELYLNRSETREDKAPEVTAILPVTHDNFWELEFQEKLRQRPDVGTIDLPREVKAELRPHQIAAFHWQCEAWSAGLPGVLNADEQGLGKTLQTLSFLSWLSNQMEEGITETLPFLIVAPTSLLRNWEDELAIHLDEGVWGEPVRLYGNGLKSWRVRGSRGRDIQDGSSKLDLSSLNDGTAPRLVITTYQTLANYAVTFAETNFAVAVFDEIQNLKNPATLRSNAAKAVNADFRIGLTGTPVENATRDIWAVMDQLFAGALGSLNDFRIAFDVPKQGNMKQLHQAIFMSNQGYPSLGLRRTKEFAASDLPPKVRVLHPRIMPDVQALRYDEARKPGQSLFGLLHHIRRTSLHPGLLDGEEPENFVHASARVSAAVDILHSIKAKNERALVFVENLDVQTWLAELLKIEFGLSRVDIINGATPVSRRKAITDRFQRHIDSDEGFDILILGPRAAGTGLTLTAANHVIHLTRWWNPAVEEQCNDRTHRIGQSRPVTVHIPLAIHPRLQRQSFDCLLQSLMKRKRTLADSVLWPPEGDENEVRALYDAIVSDEVECEERPDFEDLTLVDRPDLDVERLGPDILRVRPKRGGASVVVALQDTALNAGVLKFESDAAAIVLSEREKWRSNLSVPVSFLNEQTLWPEFVLPE
ncbi:DEAD/DEAH box helicase [Celeribacter arenosi]|uniref:DEAD/DEAH box helicase n=1 Tax=Celeribacter arenosi TaxID=792649 RepID=A0ABP7KFQ6_9RHOB